jgi:hypothetical protein
MSVTAREVQNAIESYNEQVETYNEENKDAWREPFAQTLIDGSVYNPETKKYEDVKVELDGLGEVTLVDSKPGQEGGGEDIWIVFHVGNQLFKLTGWYGSWDGSNWDEGDVFEVVAEEKIVVVYNKKK